MYVIVGTRTIAGGVASGKNSGIAVFRRGADSNDKLSLEHLHTIRCTNPTYLHVMNTSATTTALYCVQEKSSDDADGLLTFAVTDWSLGGGVTLLTRQPTRGIDSCWISTIGGDGHTLVVANYSSGSVHTYRLDADGRPTPTTFRQFTDCSRATDRQHSSHAHSAVYHHSTRTVSPFSMRSTFMAQVFVADLGGDCVYQLAVTAANDIGAIRDTIRVRPGCGPRHLLCHPQKNDIVYLTCELSSEVVVLQSNDGHFQQVQSLSTLITTVAPMVTEYPQTVGSFSFGHGCLGVTLGNDRRRQVALRRQSRAAKFNRRVCRGQHYWFVGARGRVVKRRTGATTFCNRQESHADCKPRRGQHCRDEHKPKQRSLEARSCIPMCHSAVHLVR